MVWKKEHEEFRLVLDMPEFAVRREKLFKRLARPLHERYCKTLICDDFLAYQRMDLFIYHMLWHKICVREGYLHRFIRYTHDPLAVAVASL